MGRSQAQTPLLLLLLGFLLSFPLSQVTASRSSADWEAWVSTTASYSEPSWVEAPLSQGPWAMCPVLWSLENSGSPAAWAFWGVSALARLVPRAQGLASCKGTAEPDAQIWCLP